MVQELTTAAGIIPDKLTLTLTRHEVYEVVQQLRRHLSPARVPPSVLSEDLLDERLARIHPRLYARYRTMEMKRKREARISFGQLDLRCLYEVLSRAGSMEPELLLAYGKMDQVLKNYTHLIDLT